MLRLGLPSGAVATRSKSTLLRLVAHPSPPQPSRCPILPGPQQPTNTTYCRGPGRVGRKPPDPPSPCGLKARPNLAWGNAPGPPTYFRARLKALTTRTRATPLRPSPNYLKLSATQKSHSRLVAHPDPTTTASVPHPARPPITQDHLQGQRPGRVGRKPPNPPIPCGLKARPTLAWGNAPGPPTYSRARLKALTTASQGNALQPPANLQSPTRGCPTSRL